MSASKNTTSYTTVAIMCLFTFAFNPGAAANISNNTKPVFYIGEYSLGPYSMAKFMHMHIPPYVTKMALESGLLAEAVPNWRDFTVEYVSAKSMVWYFSQAAKALPHVLGGVMCSDPGIPAVVALVGDFGSQSSTTFASITGVYNVPQVSAAIGESLSQKTYFPYFVRSTAPGSQAGKGYAILCDFFGWLRVFVLYRKESNSDAIANAFASSHRKLNVAADVTLVVYAKPFSLDSFAVTKNANGLHRIGELANYSDGLAEWYELLASKEPRIFLEADAKEVTALLKTALAGKHGLVGPGYVWMQPPGICPIWFDVRGSMVDLEEARKLSPNSSVWQIDYSQVINLSLFMFLIDAQTVGPLWRGTNWTKLMNEMTPQKLINSGAGYFDVFDPNNADPRGKSFRNWIDYAINDAYPSFYLTIYDASLTIYAAIGRLLKQGTPSADVKGKTLLDEILKSDFEGFSGRVVFNENSDRLLPMTVSQVLPIHDAVRNSPTSHHKVGIAYTSTGVFEKVREIKFAGGSTVAPRDDRGPCLQGTEYLGRKIGCSDCKPGYYNQVKESMTAKCLACGEGQIAPGSKSTSCESCPAGSIAGSSGSSMCGRCPAGSNAAKGGLGACTQCPAGMFSLAGAIKCDLCTKGRYTSAPGMTTCSSCTPTFSTEARGSVSKDECVCPAGTYRNPADDICVQCIEGLGCPGGNNDPPSQLEGYYVEVVDAKTLDLDVFVCAMKDWCPQGQLSTCAEARTGRACARIASNLDPCPGWSYPLSVTVGLIIIVIATHPRMQAHFGSVSILSTLAAMMTITCHAMQAINVQFQFYDETPPMLVTLDAGSRPFSFKMDTFLPQCGLGESFAARLSLPLIPIFFVGSSMAFLLLVSFVTKAAFLKMETAANTMGAFLQAMLIALCKGSFSFFCRRVNPSPVETLQDFSDVIFGSDTHLAGDAMLVESVLFLITIGVLSIFVFIVKVGPNRRASESFRAMVRFLLGKFRPGCGWWGIVVLVRNVCICLVPIIFVGEHILRVEAFVVVMLTSALAQMYFKPWLSNITCVYDCISSSLVCFVALCGMAFAPASAKKETAAALMHISAGCIILVLFSFMTYFTIKSTGATRRLGEDKKIAIGKRLIDKCVRIHETVYRSAPSEAIFKSMFSTMYDYDWKVVVEAAKLLDDGTQNTSTRAAAAEALPRAAGEEAGRNGAQGEVVGNDEVSQLIAMIAAKDEEIAALHKQIPQANGISVEVFM